MTNKFPLLEFGKDDGNRRARVSIKSRRAKQCANKKTVGTTLINSKQVVRLQEALRPNLGKVPKGSKGIEK